MSWLKENYEKVALGGAAVIALGIGALIITGDAGKVEPEKNPTKENTYVLPGRVDLANYSKALTQKSSAVFPQHLGADLNTFIAFPLYGVKGTDGLTELKEDTLFHGIKLSWWKKHGLEDYRFSGGGENDTDKDGFSHIEEHQGNTSPVDPKSHPDLIAKLKFTDFKPSRYRIQWTSIDENRVNMTFSVGRKSSSDFTKLGETFPTKQQDKKYLDRFKFVKRGREMNPTTNFVDEFVEVEDLLKKAVTKVFRSDGAKKFTDWQVTLNLPTPTGGKKFTVPEGGEFSLPYKAGGKGYKFKIEDKRDPKLKKLKSVDIEYKAGDITKTETLLLKGTKPVVQKKADLIEDKAPVEEGKEGE